MLFGRRKSSTQVDAKQEDGDAKKRNRLSKPLTNKSSSNLALLAVPDSDVASRNASVEAVAAPESPQIPAAEKRQQIRAHVFDSDPGPVKAVSKRSSWIGVAAFVSRIESSQPASNSSQQSLLLPVKQRGSMTGLFSSRRSSGAKRPPLSAENNSAEKIAPLSKDQPANSSSASLDHSPEPAFPTTRRSSFIPGTATRKASGVDSIQEEPSKPDPKNEDPIQEEVVDDSDAMSFSEGDDEEWFPPPPMPRAETPQSLDYTHLGGLRLGSLQVINGRASPAASVAATSIASRQLLAQMVARRDASSEYGDSDPGDGSPFLLSANPRTPPSHSREVSWYSQRTSKLSTVEVFELPARFVKQSQAVDLASAMAAEYIAELPTSPFKVERTSSDASLRKERVEEPCSIEGVAPSPLEHDLKHSESMETISHRSSSAAPSEQSSTGSVLRTTTKRNEIDDELFDDETLGPSRASPEPDRASVESWHSWHSSPDPLFARPEAFESAVEFQLQQSPQPSPQRSPLRSPMRSPQPRLERSPERTIEKPPQRLEPAATLVQSDSGYSSNNSVRSSSWERKSMMEQQRWRSPQKPKVPSQRPPEPEPDQPKPIGKLHKPILKTRKTAPAVPSFSELRPVPKTVMSTASDIPKLEAEKPKTRKKLQKRNLVRKQKEEELYVQTVASVDDLTIPRIPPEIQANLHIRTQQVPELEKTYKTMHHIRSQASIPVMEFPKVELRFPSPEPAPHPKSRRRSWLPGVAREDKPKPGHSSLISERDARVMINDFGSVNRYLGANPYDPARDNAPIRRQNSNQLSPFNVSTKPPRPRSMFDGKTAAEFARIRSNSIRERDYWNQRRTSFNDRGGIPGRNIRPASIISDAPPMPPLPSSDVLQRSISGMDRSMAPPPPPHSPRPSYVEPDYGPEDTGLAPPPPSHSPRPMDISEMEDPWAAQAAAWKARRNSLGEALKRPSYQDHHLDEEALEDDEPLYPSIPQRGQQNCYQAQRHYSYQPGDYNHSYDFQDPYGYNGQQYQPHDAYNANGSHMQPYSRHHTSPQQQMQFYTQPYDPSTDASSRPLPQPSQPAKRSPAPSIRSARSAASSLAEELHPELSEPRQHPAPEFGRYSGGMGYGYQREKGFGGSAGTRSVSGKADVEYKGVQLRGGWGVDLGDVPVIGVVKKVC